MSSDRDSTVSTAPASAGYQYAGAWIRLLAWIIDGFIAWILILLLFGLFVIAHGGGFDYFGYLSDRSRSGWVTGLIEYLLTSFGLIGWYAAWQANAGASPGMMLLNLSVRGPNRLDKPSFVAAAVRNAIPVLAAANSLSGQDWIDNVLGLVSLGVYAAIGISIAKSPTCQGFHDRLAGGTYVLRRVPA